MNEQGNPHGYEAGFTIEQHRDELIDRLGKAIKAITAQDAEIKRLRDALELLLSPVEHLRGCLWLKSRAMPCQCGFNDRINKAMDTARAALATPAPEQAHTKDGAE